MRGVLLRPAAGLVAGLFFLGATGQQRPAPRRVTLGAGASRGVEFAVQSGRAYGLLVWAPQPGAFRKDDAVTVRFTDPAGGKIEKALHAGDPDLYATVRPAASGKATLALEPAGIEKGRTIAVDIELAPLGTGAAAGAQLGSAMHTSWESAEPIELGRKVFSSADDRPYIPRLGTAQETFEQMLAGVHWYRFDYQGPGEKLLHVNLEMLDRDVPVDVAVFTVSDGRPAEYTRGRERYEPEKSTNFHGLHKFVPRVIAPGRYWIRVMGNHPAYQLQTELYEPPPYADPRQAVRTAMDYIVRKGDSWHANVPRKGAVALRTSNPLQETRLCIGCHPTHFSTRGELLAMENGYPVRARQSLQFLTERLANNPRPIYGKTDASWARMIHAPGNVLSRVAYLVNKFELQVTGERREELYRGIAKYLEMYWPGMKEPQPESNGNLPRISGFEVALHNALLFEDLHRRTGDAGHAALRRQIEEAVAAGEPADMLDLAWKLDALVSLDREKYRVQIGQLVQQIFSHQKPDGSWAMPLGMEVTEYDWRTRRVLRRKLPALPGQEGPRSSDFQTWHAVYALARAGVGLDDPRLKKAVDLCLSRQTPSGAWQGQPDYKNFDTPFRDTQYALMALSTLFPGPKGRGGARGWGAGFPAPPAGFEETNPAAVVTALDQHWDRPGAPTVARIRKLAQSPHVLVRYQAAVALGRFADHDSIETLAARLGDPSKLVQRASAWALRQVASRRPEARARVVASIRAALASPDERTRWGAARIFNQHFKYISEEWELGQELLRLAAEESVPATRIAAIQALYQWWYWDRSVEHKEAIERTLMAGLGRAEHPWVRRNFIEAYYLVLDDNLRYLYGSWNVRVKREQDRAAIRQAHQAHVRGQAQRYRDAMVAASPLAKDGLLRALYTHHVREGLGEVSALARAPVAATLAGPWVNGYKWAALYDPLVGGTGAQVSIGNDSEPPTFYEDSAPLMNEAFLAALVDPSPALITGTLHALKFLRPFAINTDLAVRVLDLVESAPAGVRAEVAESARALLAETPLADPKAASQLAAMIRRGDAASVGVAATLVTDRRQKKLAADAGIAQAVAERLSKTTAEDAVFPALVAIAAEMPALRRNPELAPRLVAAVGSSQAGSRQAALKLVLGDPRLLELEPARRSWDGYPQHREPAVFVETLATLGALNLQDARYQGATAEIRRILLAGLDHAAAAVRRQALSSLHAMESFQKEPEVVSRLEKLVRDQDVDVRRPAQALRAQLEARASGGVARADDLLDYQFFKYNVEPVLIAKGADGMACATCHANHTIFKLNEADEYGVLTQQKSTANYQAALRVVNVKDPENSLLLNKPVSPTDDQGVGDSREFSHGGGIRWADRQQSREYNNILRWIRGGRVDSRPAGVSEN